MRHVIRKGDSTTHGGIVVEGLANYKIMGREVSCKGHLVYCPLCKNHYPIMEGESLMVIGGKEVALEGMKTGCGATLISTQYLVAIGD